MNAIRQTMLVLVVAVGLAGAARADRYAAQNGQTPDPGGAYASWTSAASNIQDAVNVALTNETVWVGAGRYTLPPNATNHVGSNVVYINRPLTLRSSNGVPEDTILDGEGTNRAIALFFPNHNTNRFIIRGFTITNCYATNVGGGILFNPHNWNWTGEVHTCVFTHNTVGYGTNNGYFNNTAGSRGGALGTYNNACNFGLIVSNCDFRHNLALPGCLVVDIVTNYVVSYGGAIHIRASGQRLYTGCLFESNLAVQGGALYTDGTLERCVIRFNTANRQGTTIPVGSACGGGLSAGGPTFRNCLVYGNAAEAYGGGVHGAYGRGEFYNTTIASNRTGSGYGGGFHLRFVNQLAAVKFVNSIVYSNTPNNVVIDNYTNSTGAIALWFTNNCLTTNGISGYQIIGLLDPANGNITNPPAFADFAADNYRLTDASPCVNAGTNAGASLIGDLDLDGRPRIDRFFRRVDMGCYEYLPPGSLIGAR